MKSSTLRLSDQHPCSIVSLSLSSYHYLTRYPVCPVFPLYITRFTGQAEALPIPQSPDNLHYNLQF